MIYKIDPNKVNAVAGKKVLFMLSLIIGMMALMLFGLSQGLNPGKSMLPILSRALPGFVLIMLFISGTLFFRMMNYYKAIAFQVTNDGVMQFVSNDKLNAVNKFAAARNKGRYGSNQNQIIPYSQISSINITSNKIKIKSTNYNFFNGNGALDIPKETEKYEDLVEHFEKLKKELRLS